MDFNFEKFKQRYDREVVKLMRDGIIPGMSVLITKDGKTIYERSYGSREWNNSKPANSDTIYGIASMTKSLTSLAILQLQDAGKLNINDPISDYIPVSLGYDDDPIKIKHLMSHASGIPNLSSYATQIKNEDLTTFKIKNLPMNNWDDFYFHVNDAKDWVISKPDTKYYYNNDAYTMLSQIVANVSGKTYEKYVTENILKPIGMDRSTFSREDLKADDNVSSGYSSDVNENELVRKPKPHMSGPFNSGAGGLNSTVRDLTKYLQMHLNKGKVGNKSIISEGLLNEMYKPHNKNSQNEFTLLPFKKAAYGFGFGVVEEYLGYSLVHHGGASGVSGGHLAFIPELNITYVHLYNVGWFSGATLHLAMASLIGKDPMEVVPYFKRRAHFEKLVGKYVTYRKMLECEILNRAGTLYLESDIVSKESFPLIPIDPEEITPFEFYQYAGFGRLKIIFTIQDDNTVYLEVERTLYRKFEKFAEIEPF